MLSTPSIKSQIKQLTVEGNLYLSQAVKTGNFSDYAKAIQEFSSAYKFALLLNAKDGTQEICCFNLGAANIAGGDTERGIALLETVLEFSNFRMEDDKNDFQTYKGDAYFNLALGHEKLQHRDKAVKSYQAALLQYDQQDHPKRTCEAYLKIANIGNVKCEFSEARRNFEIASKIYLKNNEIGNSLMARICQANSAYHDKTYSREEVIKILNSICKDYSRVRSKNFQGKILCEAGILYFVLEKFDSALYCFNECIKLFNQAANKQRVALALQNAGSILNKLGYYQEALVKHKQAAQLHGFLHNRRAQGESFLNLAFAHQELGHLDDAEEAFLHALKAFEDTGDKSGQLKCREPLGVLAFNQGNSIKATRHFKVALACIPEGLDDGSKDRILRNLSKTSKLHQQESTAPKQIAYKTSAPPSNDQVAPYTNGEVDSGVRRHPNRSGKRKNFERGRRDYSDENDRPVHQVARGISNLTDFTVQSLRKEYSSESDSTDSDSTDSLSALNQLMIRSISADGSVANQRGQSLSKRRTHKKHLRRLVQASTLPINSVTSLKDDEQSPKKAEDGNAFEQSGDMERIYRQQLANIEEASSEEDGDFTDVSSNSSDSSLSSDSTPRRAISVKAKRRDDKERNANDALPKLPNSKDTWDTRIRSPDNTHLYATVRKTTQPQSETAASKSNETNSKDGDVPDAAQLTVNETEGQSESPTIPEARILDVAGIESTQKEDEETPPDLPPLRPPPSENTKRKDKKSKMCIVM